MTNTSLKQVFTHLEDALAAYHNVNRLSSTTLAAILNTEKFTYADTFSTDTFTTDTFSANTFTQGENEHRLDDYAEVSGTALRNLLDSVIDNISLMPRCVALAEQTWQPEDYLHLRYRKRIPRVIIAQSIGYSKPHMMRLHNQLMVDAAESILEKAG